jgi:hypothetical protein
VAQTRVLLVIAHPVIGSGIETLLRLEGRYDVKRVTGPTEVAGLRDWRPNVALIDGTLLGGAPIHVGSPVLVLSGTEADGRALLRRLPEGRGWLRKDATAAEFMKMIDGVASQGTSEHTLATLGTLGALVLVLLALVVILLIVYLIWLLLY